MTEHTMTHHGEGGGKTHEARVWYVRIFKRILMVQYITFYDGRRSIIRFDNLPDVTE